MAFSRIDCLSMSKFEPKNWLLKNRETRIKDRLVNGEWREKEKSNRISPASPTKKCSFQRSQKHSYRLAIQTRYEYLTVAKILTRTNTRLTNIAQENARFSRRSCICFEFQKLIFHSRIFHESYYYSNWKIVYNFLFASLIPNYEKNNSDSCIKY